MNTSPDTLVLHLTVKELVEVIQTNINLPAPTPEAPQNPVTDGPSFTGRIIYGINGIERFFDVSHKTACEWKKTWLKPAIKQEGRKIMMDAEYALKLYGQKRPNAKA